MEKKAGHAKKPPVPKGKPKQKAKLEKNEDQIQHLASLIENVSDALISTDMQSNVISWNSAAESMYGWKAKEVIGHYVGDFLKTDFLGNTDKETALGQVLKHGHWKGEATQTRKDGSHLPIMSAVSTIKDKRGKVIGLVAINRDNTEYVQAREALDANEKRFRALIENGLDNISLLAADGTLLWESPATVRTLGYRPDEFIGRNIFDLVHPDDLNWIRDQFAELIQTPGSIQRGSFHIKNSDGSWRWVDAIATNLLNEPSVNAIVINYRDVTKRKTAEDKLRTSEERYRNLFNNMEEGVAINEIVFDENGDMVDYIVLETNSAFERQSPYKREEVIGRRATDVYEMTPEFIREWWQGSLAKQQTAQTEYYHQPSGRWFFISSTLTEKARFSTIFTNITERKQGEERVVGERNLLSTVIDNLPDYIFVKDAHSRIIMDNIAHRRLLGATTLEQVAGKTDFDFFPKELAAQYFADEEKIVRSGEPLNNHEEPVMDQDGNLRWLLTTKVPLRDHQANITGIVGINRDITERKRAEQELRDSEERFRQLADNIEEVFWITESDSKKEIYISPAGGKIWGRPIKNLLQDPQEFIESILPEDRQFVQAVLEKQTRGEKTEVEYRIQHTDGTVRWVWDRGFPVFDETGKLIRVAGIAADVTERKQTQDALREREERMQALFTILPVGVSIVDNERNIIETNPALEKIMRLSKEALLAGEHNHLKKVREDGTPLSREELPSARAMQQQKDILDVEIGIISDDKTTIWTQVSASPLPGVGAVVVTADITARKLAEEELRLSEARYRAVVENQTEFIMRWKPDGSRTFLNEAYRRYFGITDQTAHDNFIYQVDERDRGTVEGKISRLLSGATNSEISTNRVIKPNGEVAWQEWVDQAIYDESGKIIEFQAVGRDITERKRAEEIIQQYASDLERRVEERTAELTRANRAKDEFLANMSHELRTPLNSILGFSETLLDGVRGSLGERQREGVQMIASSGQHLLGLINDILDVSKIEAGKLDMHLETIDVNEICEASMNFVKELAMKKSIVLEFDASPEASTIVADPQRFKQILVNLLNNAVKFTLENGNVTLGVRADAAQNQIRFSVTDTGIGMTSENLQRLFDPFMQVDSSLSRQYDGSGLGLALVRKLTEMHGGNVVVESNVGKGSRFTVVLPWDKKAGTRQMINDSNANVSGSGKEKNVEAAKDSEMSAVDGRTIILAEDNETNVMMVKDYLEHRGHKVIVAHNGLEVLAKVEEIPPDLILMDIQMPQMDGIEAIRRLRADTRFRSTPIIAVTAFAMRGDRERCLEAGATDYLSKPISLKTLKQMIESFL